jgi:hypothetical protein
MISGFAEDFFTEAQKIFGAGAVTRQTPQNLISTPFTTLYVAEKGIVLHLITVDAEKLRQCPKGFFAQWADAAEAQQLRAIQVGEDVWEAKRSIVLSQLVSLAGQSAKIFARNTVAQRITKPEADDFLNRYHLSGSPTARYKYGLFVKKTGTLVGVATFSAPRKFNRDGKEYRSYELIRYAGINGANITGGLSKALNAFIEEVQPDDIMTYADRCWWTGESYLPLGFEWVENTPPQTCWLKPYDWVRYPEYQKPDGGGYLELENAGNRKFLLKLK